MMLDGWETILTCWSSNTPISRSRRFNSGVEAKRTTRAVVPSLKRFSGHEAGSAHLSAQAGVIGFFFTRATLGANSQDFKGRPMK
jgi:hypothetical protein